MATTPTTQQEPDYGAKQEAEVIEAAVAEEPGPTVIPEAQNVSPEDTNITPTSTLPPVTYRNPMLLLPVGANFPEMQAQKGPVERSYDIGRFWAIIASDPDADPLTRQIAASMSGRE